MVAAWKLPATSYARRKSVRHTYGGLLLCQNSYKTMSYNKNGKRLHVNNSNRQRSLVHDTDRKLKATDVIGLFPDEKIKHALSVSSINGESPLAHFMGLFEVAQEFIIFNENIDEATRGDFYTLCKQMNFYMALINETVNV